MRASTLFAALPRRHEKRSGLSAVCVARRSETRRTRAEGRGLERQREATEGQRMQTRKLSGTTLALWIAAACMAPSAHADISQFWEWELDPNGNPIRELRVAVNPADANTPIAGMTLQSYVQDAVDMWNMVQSGWTLTVVASGTPSEIFVSTDTTLTDGGAQATWLTTDGTGRTVQRGVQVNPNAVTKNDPNGNPFTWTWGKAGETKDPRAAIKHEIGHCLKLSHMDGARATSGQTMDPGGPTDPNDPIIGDHAHNEIDPNTDGSAANDSAAETFNPTTGRVEHDQDVAFIFPHPGAVPDSNMVVPAAAFDLGGADIEAAMFEHQGGTFGIPPPGLLPALRGIILTTTTDPSAFLAPGGLVGFTISLATGFGGTTYDLGDPEYAGLFSDVYRVSVGSIPLDGDPNSEISLSGIAWEDVTPLDLLVSSDSTQVTVQFALPADLLFSAGPAPLQTWVGVTTLNAQTLNFPIPLLGVYGLALLALLLGLAALSLRARSTG